MPDDTELMHQYRGAVWRFREAFKSGASLDDPRNKLEEIYNQMSAADRSLSDQFWLQAQLSWP